MPSSEKEALLPSNASGSGPSYYFLKNDSSSHEARDMDGGEVVEQLPEGATAEDFASRPVGSVRSRKSGPASKQGFWERFFVFGRRQENGGGPSQRPYGEVGTLLVERKVPVKVEPKVFFANERTYLAWLHVSVILAGASVAIVAFADPTNPWSQLYGIILLPVAVAFILYSMYMYAKRAAMIRRKDPGPYEDTVGPTVLGIMLMLSIVAQFGIKLYTMM